MFETGAGFIEIFNDAEVQLNTGTVRHFTLTVDDVDVCVKAVKDAGYVVFEESKDIVIPSTQPFPARMAFFCDPIGEEIEFFRER